MAILDEPDIKVLADSIRRVIQKDGIKEEFAIPSKEFVTEDVVKEAAFAILGFDDWYFNPESSRNKWIPTNLGDYEDEELLPVVRGYVEETLEELRDPDALEPLPYEPDVDELVNKLVGLVVNWQDWYYRLKKEKEKIQWYIDKGANDAVYAESDYGDTERNPGTGNVFDEAPWDDVALEDGLVNTDLLPWN